MSSSKRTFAELRQRWILADAAIFWSTAIGVGLNILSIAASLTLLTFAPGSRIRPMYLGAVLVFCSLIGFAFGITLPTFALYAGSRRMRWRAILALFLCLSPYFVGMTVAMIILVIRQLEFLP